MRRFYLLIVLALVLTGEHGSNAGIREVVAAFKAIRNDTVFPAKGKNFDDVEETFGPRRQPSSGARYDWHRGIDIDGEIGVEIVAAYPGTFDGLRQSASAGNYLVLKHTFPSKSNPPVPFGPNPDRNTWSTFYTYYMHLDDSTLDLIKHWQIGRQIKKGELIGYMGNTGQAAGGASYSPHLHFELRFGTSNPLSSQLESDGLSVTDAWFDPNMHPYLLFNPNAKRFRGGSLDRQYRQSLAPRKTIKKPSEPIPEGEYFAYTSSLDDLPILNSFEVEIFENGSSKRAKRYVLDFNTRSGYSSDSTEELDSRNFSKPYVEPAVFDDDRRNYRTSLVIPNEWIGSLGNKRMRVTATDIWGRSAVWRSPEE